MSYLSGVVTGVLGTLLAGGAVVAGWWIFIRPAAEAKKPTPPPIPAHLAKTAKEEQLNTVTISEEAAKNLAIGTGKIDEGPKPRTRFYGGEIMIPPGRTIVVAAPFNGQLQMAGKETPQAGATVTKDSTIFKLLPLLTPEGRANLAAAKVDAEGQVENAKAQLAAADKNLLRAKMLLMDDVGSRQRVDDAEAAHILAAKSLDAVTERVKLLTKVVGEVEEGTAAPIPIKAPSGGLLRNLQAAHGQNVPAGAILFEVLDPSVVWVRVPVYVGERPAIDDSEAAKIGPLTFAKQQSLQSAKLAKAPPSANPLTGTVDLYYALDNRAGVYSPGERVGVTLTLNSDESSLTVPFAAVLYDIHGGAWVYEKTDERAYTRRRVVVRYRDGDTAVLSAGPPKGTEVVTDGAIEIFGHETGYSK